LIPFAAPSATTSMNNLPAEIFPSQGFDPGSVHKEDALRWDREHCWHPFTPMQEWSAPGEEPLLIAEASGALLKDIHGNEFLDGNSSIWTNLHGHHHPDIDAAVREQLDRFAHISYLGSGHPGASLLSRRLVEFFPETDLRRVFFSDDGSTAIEVALKMAAQYWQQNGHPDRDVFVAFDNAYHGDTVGAASLGGVPLFHERFSRFHFPVIRVRDVGELSSLTELREGRVAGVVLEPLIQGVNRMHIWPPGMLREVREICSRHDTFLILDEIMTGFGRTGRMFACQHEQVVPDFLCLAKGLTGGYLPLAATLVTERIFNGFLGDWHEGRTFFYGHSYTANALGCAAALASLAIFSREDTLGTVRRLAKILASRLEELSENCAHIADIRQIGLIAGIDLGDQNGQPLPPSARAGFRVCQAAREHGLLTRNIGDTIVLMPPYCVSDEQISTMVSAIHRAAHQVLDP
jgi:adenosylmethionine---8-amino-7-oxononanoate aminotransferase